MKLAAAKLDEAGWKDTDGDGLGDNPNGTNPDDCINSPGNSYEDREGCPDSDRDGYSNPSEGEVPCSVANPNGPDAYPQDATQWCDTDQDNYGDNLNGNNQLTNKIVFRILLCICFRPDFYLVI